MLDRHLAERGAPTTLTLPSFEASPLVWRVVGVMERIFAGILLALTLPLLLIAGLIIAVLSRQTPLIAHRRAGEAGRELWVLKLRTMWGADPRKRCSSLVERLPVTGPENPAVKQKNDPRVTSLFGARCRCYSIDEFPQLWHVVRGQMALVGPRPLTEYEIGQHYATDSRLLLSRKPGITGLWQVNGRSRLNYRQRRRLDIFLIRKWSLPLYLLIIARTVQRAFAGRDAW